MTALLSTNTARAPSRAAGGGAAGFGSYGRGAGGQQYSTPQAGRTLNKMQQAGVVNADGCIHWTGQPGSCKRSNCGFPHPAGQRSEANSKYVRLHGEQTTNPAPRRS